MDISLRIGAFLAIVGMDLEVSRVKYGQIWRKLVSETIGISIYRQTPSTLLGQHAHHGGLDSIDLLHSSIHNSINNRYHHIILYGMAGHFVL